MSDTEKKARLPQVDDRGPQDRDARRLEERATGLVAKIESVLIEGMKLSPDQAAVVFKGRNAILAELRDIMDDQAHVAAAVARSRTLAEVAEAIGKFR